MRDDIVKLNQTKLFVKVSEKSGELNLTIIMFFDLRQNEYN